VSQLGDETEAERVRRDLDDAAQFMHEVIGDPTLLDQIPNGATVIDVPKSNAEPGRSVSFETPHMVVYVGPPPPYPSATGEEQDVSISEGLPTRVLRRVASEVARRTRRVGPQR
jgi:hypothetical protein